MEEQLQEDKSCNLRRSIHLGFYMVECIEDCDLNSLIKILANKDADPNVILPDVNYTPMHAVAGSEREDFASKAATLLLDFKGDPNVRADEDLTPMHVATCSGHVKVLKVLLERGGNPYLRDIEGMSPYDYAKEMNNLEAMEVIHTLKETSCQRRVKFDTLRKRFQERSPSFKISTQRCSDLNVSQANETLVATSYNSSRLPLSEQSLFSSTPVCKDSSCDILKTSKLESCMKTFTFSSSSDNVSSFLSSSSRFETTKKSPESRKSCKRKSIRASLMRSHSPGIIHYEIIQSPLKEPKHMLGRNQFVTHNSIFAAQDKFECHTDIRSWLHNVTATESPVDSATGFVDDTVTSPVEESYYTCEEPKEDFLNVAAIGKDLFHDEDDNSGCSSTTISEKYKYTDKKAGIVLLEERLITNPNRIEADISGISSLIPNSEAETSDTDNLRTELKSHGIIYGPITPTTKKIYQKQLHKTKKMSSLFLDEKYSYSLELRHTLKDNTDFYLHHGAVLEQKMIESFTHDKNKGKWKEGSQRTSFTYLLIDSRITNNLPCRAANLKVQKVWTVFLQSIFYIGKGKRARPYAHLYEAVQKFQQHSDNWRGTNEKVKRILEIWQQGLGVVCLHVFQNTLPVEAYTREAAMIDAMGCQHLCNVKRGDYYGNAATWYFQEQRILGVYLLYKALQIFLSEGERHLSPSDIM